MTTNTDERWEALMGVGDDLSALDMPCPYCGVAIDVWCRVLGTRRMANDIHEARRHVLMGYRRGIADSRAAVFNLLKKPEKKHLKRKVD